MWKQDHTHFGLLYNVTVKQNRFCFQIFHCAGDLVAGNIPDEANIIGDFQDRSLNNIHSSNDLVMVLLACYVLQLSLTEHLEFLRDP